jgi:light-regulated signal transduction histidine kinase (bacteriophytochrome)
LYRALARNAPGAAFAVFDKDMWYLLVEGEIFTKALNMPKETTEGKTIYELFPKEVIGKFEPHYQAALRGETNTVDYVGSTKNLKDHALLLTYKPIPNPDGTIDTGMVVAIDVEKTKQSEREKEHRIQVLNELNERLQQEIEQRKKAEEESQKANAQLKERNEELQQFAYVASHDLQEPLRMVTSYLGLLVNNYKDKLDVTANEFVKYAVDGAQRMRQMITDLLQYSRVGTRGNPFAPVNLEEMLPLVEQNLSVAISESGTQITHDSLPTVNGDEAQLDRLFQNLLANAIKFRRKDVAPRIHIGAKDVGDRWEISIKDNGIGIAEKNFPRLFQIFQRLHTREEYEGTGIGLAVSKKIVERHGGTICVESKEGEGTTFVFTLPKVQGKNEDPQVSGGVEGED